MCNQHGTDNSPSSLPKVWRPDDTAQPAPSRPGSSQLYRPDILETIEAKIKEMDTELRELSLDIHGNNQYAWSTAAFLTNYKLRCSSSRTWLWRIVRLLLTHLKLSNLLTCQSCPRCLYYLHGKTRLQGHKTLSPRNCMAGDVLSWDRWQNYWY